MCRLCSRANIPSPFGQSLPSMLDYVTLVSPGNEACCSTTGIPSGKDGSPSMPGELLGVLYTLLF